jgi:hypothetical protein
MNLKEEEASLEKLFENIKDKEAKENISFIYNKTNSKKYSEYQIEISFINNNFNNNNNNTKEKSYKYHEFILEINLTKKTIILFSKNINPISDGRDIIPLVTRPTQITNNYISIDDTKISEIIKNLKNFLEIRKFSGLAGIFYVAEEYDPKIIENLENIEKIKCFHIEVINGKMMDIFSLCTISDENFCLYEKEQNKYNLVFYSNLKNLLSFNKSIDSIVTLIWKKKFLTNNNENDYCSFELKIKSNNDEDMDRVMDILIAKIKNIGFKMNISEQKKGVLPNLDVEKMEGEINRLESQLKKKENILVFNKLLEKYEKIIEYYSAANDNKYIEYNNKMKDLLSNEKYSKYIK